MLQGSPKAINFLRMTLSLTWRCIIDEPSTSGFVTGRFSSKVYDQKDTRKVWVILTLLFKVKDLYTMYTCNALIFKISKLSFSTALEQYTVSLCQYNKLPSSSPSAFIEFLDIWRCMLEINLDLILVHSFENLNNYIHCLFFCIVTHAI